MKSNIIPKFLFDVSRLHMAGDVDFVVCTDARYGFVARVEVGDTPFIGVGAGCACGEDNGKYIMMRIVRTFSGSEICDKHTELLNDAFRRYLTYIGKTCSPDSPTDAQMEAFLTALAGMFQQHCAVKRAEGDDDNTWEQLIRMVISTRNRFKELRAK